MLRGLAIMAALGVAAIFLFTGQARGQGVELNIVTGGPAGTYIQFGRDIAAVGAACGQRLNVRESAGSLENVFAVRDRPLTQFGIVQSDVLEYLQTFRDADPLLGRVADGLRIVYPLYDEEVHILARRGIATVSDLAGQRVAIGLENSGTYITASLVFDLARVEPAERRTDLAPSEALAALKAGEIDAMFYVVGAPAALFDDPAIAEAGFHLVAMDDPVLRAVYTPAVIEAETYPFLDEPVEIVAVKAVLMTFEFDPRRSAYHRASCRGVSDFAYLILTRLDDLRASGHPKWRDVDMTALPPGWAVASCALDGVDPAYEFTCIGEDGTRIVESAAPEPVQANALFLRRICERIDC